MAEQEIGKKPYHARMPAQLPAKGSRGCRSGPVLSPAVWLPLLPMLLLGSLARGPALVSAADLSLSLRSVSPLAGPLARIVVPPSRIGGGAPGTDAGAGDNIGDDHLDNFCGSFDPGCARLRVDDTAEGGMLGIRRDPRTFVPVAFLPGEQHRQWQQQQQEQQQQAGQPPRPREEDRFRSDASLQSQLPAPLRSSFKKTGTTIAGCVVYHNATATRDGAAKAGGTPPPSGPCVVLAADTRATAETLVADKACDKIHKLASNCRCCGAGTSADLDKLTRQVLYQVAMDELGGRTVGNGGLSGGQRPETTEKEAAEVLYQDYGGSGGFAKGQPLLWMRPVSIDGICGVFRDVLFRNGGRIGANLIVGGVWKQKAFLRAIHPHGSTDADLPFCALGSGGAAAMAVLEDGWARNLSLEEGVDLVRRAVLSGIRNDLGSGSAVDLCVVYPDGSCVQTRGLVPEEELPPERTEDGSGRDACGSAPPPARAPAGVNGFGNQPLSLEGKAQRMPCTETDQTERTRAWDRVLGL